MTFVTKRCKYTRLVIGILALVIGSPLLLLVLLGICSEWVCKKVISKLDYFTLWLWWPTLRGKTVLDIIKNQRDD